MKKTLFATLVSLGALLVLLTVTASASNTFTQGDWEYTISDGTAYVSQYNGSDTSVTIPTSVTYAGQTYSIRTVGAYCFEDNTKIQSVTIPEEITSLRRYAFRNCTFLSKVTINGDLADCNGYYVFYNTGTNADSFSVTFGNGVTRVPASIFHTGTDESKNVYAHITSVSIPSTVTEIGDQAFYGCYDLSTVSIANGLNSIGDYSFAYCTSLTSIVIPVSVTSLGKRAFNNCTYLSSVTINGDLDDCSRSSHVFYNTGTNANSFSVTFGPGVSQIPAYIFSTSSSESDYTYCHVDTVSIRNGVTKIGKNAFNNCYDLTTIYYQGTQNMWSGISGTDESGMNGDVSIVYENICFNDVLNNAAYYYIPVYWAYDLEITAGYEDGTFRPNSNCTRAEFATFLYTLARAYGLENAGDTASRSFTDVKSGSWYYDYVIWAAENGLVSGYSDGTFRPNNQITRAEAVTMLYGFYKTFVNGGEDPEVSQQGNTFSDLSDSAWYYNYMMWAIQNDVVSGYTDGTCRPTTSCTRSVMVVLLYATAGNLLD